LAGRRVPHLATSARRATLELVAPVRHNAHGNAVSERPFEWHPFPHASTAPHRTVRARVRVERTGRRSHWATSSRHLDRPAGTVATTCTGSSAKRPSSRSKTRVGVGLLLRGCRDENDWPDDGFQPIRIRLRLGIKNTRPDHLHPHRPSRFAGTGTACRSLSASAGARRKNSSTDATGGTLTLARILLIGGRIYPLDCTHHSGPHGGITHPAHRNPNSGLRPSPNGGTPADCSGGVYGERQAQGMPPASAADRAPQQFTVHEQCVGANAAPTANRRDRRLRTRRAGQTPRLRAFSAARGLVCLPVIEAGIASMSGSIASRREAKPLPDLYTGGECAQMGPCGRGGTNSDSSALIGNR